MSVAQRGARFGYAFALVVLANAAPARADENARTYAASYELDSPNGVVRASETLGVRRENATSFVSVSNSSGALVSLPTEFAKDGEIMANSFDPSVTCYNMAAAALYASESAPASPSPVFVRFGDATVAIPLKLTASGPAGGERTFVGMGATAFTISSESAQISAGMVVNARIAVTGGELSDVVFSEATLAGSPAKPVSRMTCSLTKARDAAPTTVTPNAVAPNAVLPG
jgi:hypothetical protein